MAHHSFVLESDSGCGMKTSQNQSRGRRGLGRGRIQGLLRRWNRQGLIVHEKGMSSATDFFFFSGNTECWNRARMRNGDLWAAVWCADGTVGLFRKQLLCVTAMREVQDPVGAPGAGSWWGLESFLEGAVLRRELCDKACFATQPGFLWFWEGSNFLNRSGSFQRCGLCQVGRT